MSIIQQPTLFDSQILEELAIEEKYNEIFSPLELSSLVGLFQKEARVGAPITVNYEASLRALMVSFLEGIPTIKALVIRIKQDLRFKLSLGFLYSERATSEATFSRILHTLSEHRSALIHQNNGLLQVINREFGVFSEPVAIDATAVKGHTDAKKTEDKIPVSSAKTQQTMTLEEIKNELTINPQWGIKANSQHRNNYWFGYKAHVAVSSETQYILSAIQTSAHLSDSSVAIPLMRTLQKLGVRNIPVLFDKGYDAKAIYQEALALNFKPIIPLKKVGKNDGQWTDDYAPTCLREHGYKYDSFDQRYGALKFKQPKEHCQTCPLFHEDLCQKVIKIKQQTDPRKFAQPARGTNAWTKLYAKRSSV